MPNKMWRKRTGAWLSKEMVDRTTERMNKGENSED